MNDLISRQATIEAMEDVDWYHINKDGQLTHGANSKEDEPLYKAEDVYKVLNDMPSAQPETHEERTETHSCDCISRKEAIDAHYEYCNKHPDAGFPVWSLKILEDLPSAQPEQTNSWYINSWCNNCKEYDTENKCCPRYNRVIKQTLDEVYAHAETEAEARFHTEIVQCKDCKYWNDEFAKDKSTCWLPCMSMTTHREWHCGSAERRTDGVDS